MTGIADLYLYLKRPYSKDRRKRLLAHITGTKETTTRFVVLGWKRTGSNWLCGMLHHHPDICMHNELFNPIDIFTYHPKVVVEHGRWTVLTRDLFPINFLNFVWDPDTIRLIRPSAKAVGFKSFPEHWVDSRNEGVWEEHLLHDLRVRKIVLHREDELAVYVSMQRAEITGRYMTHSYPSSLQIRVDPAKFQAFVNHYRHTFRKKYKSPLVGRDTFTITYEEMMDTESFQKDILPKLFEFLRVNPSIVPRALRETVQQAPPNEDLSEVISNYEELEFCFRHSDVLHFQKRREETGTPRETGPNMTTGTPALEAPLSTWSILLPICSRLQLSQKKPVHDVNGFATKDNFNANRFLEVAKTSQHDGQSMMGANCWAMLQEFFDSLKATSNPLQLAKTECIVGVDVDDQVYANQAARERIQQMAPCAVTFVDVLPPMYGHVCRIWNHLARRATNDYVVLLGDDVRLLDPDWQANTVQTFHSISHRQGLPLGAACVALNDVSFPGFPTFPVIHRWHIKTFGGNLLPKQFSNQGGDPYLYELYSRFDSAQFVLKCRLDNMIGGDDDARYRKHHINWKSQILNIGIRKLRDELGINNPSGIVLDVVIPSYRVHNEDYLSKLVSIRATCRMYVRFWIIVDNPLPSHVREVKAMAERLNQVQLQKDGNYFINVIHYSENRGASYARNTGFNYSTADWILFLDDDVIPDDNILDAYAGAIRRYPHAKVFVGNTDLPEACGVWTEMLRACNVGYFYSIAKRMTHPSWGVTANLMVRGSRYNTTIQFKDCYPKTGGGEDIDLVWQFKAWYPSLGNLVTVGVPEATVKHPWWNSGKTCYRQICGWAWGDSLCISEWYDKTFLTMPNWIEHVVFVVSPSALIMGVPGTGVLVGLGVIALEHVFKAAAYFSDAKRIVGTKGGIFRTIFVAFGAGSVLSAQEVTRVVALLRRGSIRSICRRVDWFDGQEGRIRLDIQLGSVLRFGLNMGLTALAFGWPKSRKSKD